MPEREELIAQWRRNLAQATGCTNEVLDELESHLRDELQQLIQSGHTEEQAFALATSRLGPPRALATEFAKVAEPASWLPIRLARFAVTILTTLVVGFLLLRWQEGRLDLLVATHVGAITLGYTISLLAGALVICYVATRPFHDLTAGQIRGLERAVLVLTATAAVLTLIGILLGCVWAKDHLGRFWSWDPREIGAAVVVIWETFLILLLMARVWEHRVILLSILGNGLVGFAWFATAWLADAQKVRAYGPRTDLQIAVIIFALIQLLFFGLGFLPAGSLRRRAV
jgi:hypothetical protein